jgi:hypothetical protein
MIQQVINEKIHYLFVAKPDDHKYMMEWIGGFDALPEVVVAVGKLRTSVSIH